MKKNITINGNNFSDLSGFYAEIQNLLSKNLDWKTGSGLHLFNDMLRGGFGVHNFEEPIKLIWLNSAKSKIDLDFPATIKLAPNMTLANRPISEQIVSEHDDFVKSKKIQVLFSMLIDIIKAHPHIELVLE